MSTKINVFVTGANTGLGLEIVRALAKSEQAYRIFMGSRSVEKAEQAIAALKAEIPNSASTVEPIQIDISSDQSIEAAFKTISGVVDHLEVLVNNAGINIEAEAAADKISVRDAWNQMFDVNVTGTHITTHTFAPLLLKSNDPRLLFMASGTASIEEASQGKPPTAPIFPAGWPKDDKWPLTAYRSIKSGLNMVMMEWNRILKNDKVKIFAVSPGFLATGLAGAGEEKLLSMGAKPAYVGGEFVRDVIQGQRDADVAKVIRTSAGPLPPIQPW